MDSGHREPRLRPSPRAVFAQQFAALFEAAGSPTLRRVAAEARMRAARGPGQKGGASVQRISAICRSGICRIRDSRSSRVVVFR